MLLIECRQPFLGLFLLLFLSHYLQDLAYSVTFVVSLPGGVTVVRKQIQMASGRFVSEFLLLITKAAYGIIISQFFVCLSVWLMMFPKGDLSAAQSLAA